MDGLCVCVTSEGGRTEEISEELLHCQGDASRVTFLEDLSVKVKAT